METEEKEININERGRVIMKRRFHEDFRLNCIIITSYAKDSSEVIL